MAASEVAQKERDVPTFRRIAGAGLEVAGALGPDLELEEDEEEAAARRARSFAQDARVRFLGGRLEPVLGLPAEKWSRHLESEDNRQVLGAFLESPSPACLVFSVAAAGWLAASPKVRSDGRGDPASPPPGATDPRAGQASRAPSGSRGARTRALKKLSLKLPRSRQNSPQVRPLCSAASGRMRFSRRSALVPPRPG